MNTVAATLRNAPCERRDAEQLLCRVLNWPRTKVFTDSDYELTEGEQAAYNTLIARLGEGEPLAYILGEREFWSLPLKVSPAVLIPRPDTELLVEWAVELIREYQLKTVVDLGTGSGAIALALASENLGVDITALDQSEQALAVAEDNGARLSLEVTWVLSDWFNAFSPDHRWDLIVSNPPYIRSDDPHLTMGDLPAEPVSALVGGESGLDCYRAILSEAGARLNKGGWLAFEHGYDQAEDLQQMLSDTGFVNVETRRDLAGQPRVTAGRWCQ